MLRRILPAFLLLAGCGNSTEVYPNTCSGPCFNSIESVDQIDCDRLRADIATATQVITNIYRIAEYPELCNAVSNVTLSVKSEDDSFTHDNHNCRGIFDKNHIYITRSTNALAHEMLHALDKARNVRQSGDPHYLWDKNHFFDADNTYVDNAVDVTLNTK